MRMLYKSHRSEIIGLYQSHLETLGIETMLKNQFTEGTWSTDPDCPELWVLDSQQYEQAVVALQQLGVS
ncbi:putative signal transducing protein [Haloferula rosea]|uniref:DUF2007 domain-containing protein n=1 Tax=Haloferula rosea TaxID=490093 RepID=A0A934R7N9_9BACT|nr:DUF2007 domain-containing protein [Haloferula rosea]MBK1826784.1 DUF2007 domain-containing protein [Haloferula rosea]